MTVQRLIELIGITTVGITVAPDETSQANPPRALYPEGCRPGHSLGGTDPELQRQILRDALDLAVSATLPGEIVTRIYSARASPTGRTST